MSKSRKAKRPKLPKGAELSRHAIMRFMEDSGDDAPAILGQVLKVAKLRRVSGRLQVYRTKSWSVLYDSARNVIVSMMHRRAKRKRPHTVAFRRIRIPANGNENRELGVG